MGDTTRIQPPRECPPGQGPRSPGLAYADLLDTDTRRVPDVLRWQSARELPEARVPIERYTSPAFHALEVERVWKKVWQMACREEEIPEVGDHVLYEIADVTLVVVRAAENEIRAFHNTCLHRGRPLRDEGGRVERFRCPFHGWTWDLRGELAELPCRWDFPHVERESYRLPEAKVGTWGGFVFVNLDPGCQSLAAYLGDLPKHFEPWPLEQRYKEAHVAKRLPCNWKVAQEAFMEAYHVVGTHPQLLPGIGDANSQYDAWDTFSRAITANMTPSPHLERVPGEQEQLDSLITRSEDAAPTFQVPEGMTARQILAQITRMQLQGAVPGIQDVSDAELADSFYYSVFPNFHPWGAYNKLVYRFRPWGNDAQQCVMEAIYLAPFRGRRPKPAPVHWLGDDEDWTRAPELGFLARVFNQDTANLGRIQRGLRGAAHTHVTFGQYQETKIRHFHALLERYLA
ncbi:MAG TPA: aromatic ring-hydroxylating dioxygenase subunit alpha [Myxococcota bacterium]|nr:aromatic ring-hydroxylating dioxygenase subunit alpha [Myxococcota bacterium]